jgi:hypothetical protein
MNKKVKAKTFTLVAINQRYDPVYAFPDRRKALCCGFVKSYLGVPLAHKAPRKIKVHVRTTMAAGYTKLKHYDHWVVSGGGWNVLLFSDAAEALDSVVGTRKTFYFKITEKG